MKILGHYLGHYKSRPLFYFLSAMLILIVLSPLLENTKYGKWAIQILFTIMLAASVYAASDRQVFRNIAICLAVPWLFLSWGSDLGYVTESDIVKSGFVVTLNLFVGCIILQRVILARDVNLNILSGAIGLYLLMAITWAVSYEMIENLVPGSFAAGETPIPWHKFLYFSLTTITTLGYGDILPTAPFSRIWATLEAVTGTLYIAVLVARLISLYKN